MIIETMVLAIIIIFFLMIFVVPGIKIVRDNEVGVLTKKMWGSPLPPGHIIATKGEVGVQADILMPGIYYRFPVFWTIDKVPVTVINPGYVGAVKSIDGQPLPIGRLLGDAVDCDSFQDAKAFLERGGYKGAQIGFLRPGNYRINLKVFSVKQTELTVVPKEQIGIVIATDGQPLPSGYIIAPSTDVRQGDHDHFQNGQVFINGGGYRGPQLETLQPGEYYINPYLFEVVLQDVAIVPPGYVAVIISSAGSELDKESTKLATMTPATPPEISTEPDLQQAVIDDTERLLITSKMTRGILRDPVSPGKYNLNRIAYRAELVPTSAVTIDWASREGTAETKVLGSGKTVIKDDHATISERVAQFFNFSQLRVTSKDGFILDVDVRLIIRIPPGNAPFVIARFGTVDNLIEQVAHPLIDASFRNEAGEKPAMEFVHSRTKLQESALDKARKEFKKYHVEVQGLLIAYISVDAKLLETQTKREIAVQQQKQYDEEATAQERRISVEEKKARADKQSDVINAKLAIDISTDRAQAARKESEGIRDFTKNKADGDAYAQAAVGKAIADAYKAQTDVIGGDKVALIKFMEVIANQGLQITPQVMVTGDSGGGNLFNAFIALLMNKDLVKLTQQPDAAAQKKS